MVEQIHAVDFDGSIPRPAEGDAVPPPGTTLNSSRTMTSGQKLGLMLKNVYFSNMSPPRRVLVAPGTGRAIRNILFGSCESNSTYQTHETLNNAIASRVQRSTYLRSAVCELVISQAAFLVLIFM